MKLGTQVYQKPKAGQKCIQVKVNPDERFTHALNLTGYLWLDQKYKIVKNALLESARVIVTDTDLLGHDDYIANIHKDCLVIFVFQGPDKKLRGPQHLLHNIGNKAFGGNGASEKRIKTALEKIKQAGIKTKFFKSEKTFLNYLKRLE